MEERNTSENADLNPQVYGQLIFDKSAKTIQREELIFLTANAGTVRYLRAKNAGGALPHTRYRN